jgi:hypothetical protein
VAHSRRDKKARRIRPHAAAPFNRALGIMSLLIVSAGLGLQQAATDHPVTKALAEAARQGFASTGDSFEWAGGSAWWFATPDNPRGSGAAVREGQRFAAYVGTVSWRGLSGESLLRRLLADYPEPQAMPLDEFAGSFAMLFSGGSGVWLFNDPLGLQKIYQTNGGRLASTSFMVCRATLDAPRVDRLRAQEYVLLGANHGLATPLADIAIADPVSARELGSNRSVVLYPPARLRSECAFASEAEAVAGVAGAIADIFGEMANAFGSNIGMALSGGFDSRLLLAALDKVEVRPVLYVYGAPNDADVQIASQIAGRLGQQIECIDKRAFNGERPALTQAALQSNLAFFDGLAPDGAFDLGADRITRLKQVERGRLNLNGGGGEILRNFFFLRDRGFTATDVTSAFYSNWPKEVFPSDDERRAFLAAMESGIAHSVRLGAAPSETLRRDEVELIYSLFRLRYWMGRNNTVAARYGLFLTPLAHPKLVPMAASLPLAWKDYGRLEAQVIAALSPRVAGGPSAYGFDFTAGPTFKHRMRIAATMYRPVALRRQSAQIRRALNLSAPAAVPHKWREVAAGLPSQDWVNVQALSDGDQLNRLLTLQAIASDTHSGVRRGARERERVLSGPAAA